MVWRYPYNGRLHSNDRKYVFQNKAYQIYHKLLPLFSLNEILTGLYKLRENSGLQCNQLLPICSRNKLVANMMQPISNIITIPFSFSLYNFLKGCNPAKFLKHTYQNQETNSHIIGTIAIVQKHQDGLGDEKRQAQQTRFSKQRERRLFPMVNSSAEQQHG